MVRADSASSGVLFTIDTESGFKDLCLITSSYGLGELVVQGSIVPDEWLVFKPLLAQTSLKPIVRQTLGGKALKMIYSSDRITGESVVTVDVKKAERDRYSLTEDEVLQLARFGSTIETHYGCPMDIEWAKDGLSGKLFIVQARPETVHSKGASAVVSSFHLAKGAMQSANVLLEGRAVGTRVCSGRVRVILQADHMSELQPGEVLVTQFTDPDWMVFLSNAAGIITARGGRTCHAAIVARELNLPAIVGVPDATTVLQDGQLVTLVCSEGDVGYVVEGAQPFEERKTDVSKVERPKTKVSLILGNPSQAFSLAAMPVSGVGLVRLEFVLTRLGVHPLAALDVDSLEPSLAARIRSTCVGSPSPKEAYVRALAEGVGSIAAAFYPHAVVVRLSDFKSSEYRGLLGGALYEPAEENPMMGWRGASRYHSAAFAPAFALECEALKRVRSVMGLTNVEILIPFVRTVAELQAVTATLAEAGLARGSGAASTPAEVQAASNCPNVSGLKVHCMCEIPSNAICAEAFLQGCDGFSIGSNDLTQLALGVDRNSSLVKAVDESDPAVKWLIARAVSAAKAAGKYAGICVRRLPPSLPRESLSLVCRARRRAICRTLRAGWCARWASAA